MIQFIDISKAILYDMEKGHNAVLSMINACVSHEMRNPLNSIIAQNIEKEEMYKKIQELTNQFISKKIKTKKFLKEHDTIMKKLKSGWKIQQSSANILGYIVQDLLDYAQIQSGNFRKNVMEFNVISAIEDVMLIQQRKAEDNNIKLYATFENIGRDDLEHELQHEFLGNEHSYMVNTD